MDYTKLIKDTLVPLNLPIEETIYTGTKPAFIVFSCYTEQAAATAANMPVEREYDFMINFYRQMENPLNIDALKDRAINLLETAGFNDVVAHDRTDLEVVGNIAKYKRWLIDCSYTENIES